MLDAVANWRLTCADPVGVVVVTSTAQSGWATRQAGHQRRGSNRLADRDRVHPQALFSVSTGTKPSRSPQRWR